MPQYSGKIIRKTPVVPTQTSASGVWTTADAAAAVKNNTWPVPGVPNPISRSLRFRSSASAYLNRTFGSPTNQKRWTLSCWVKRGALSATGDIFNGAVSGTNDNYIRFTGGNGLMIGSYNGAGTDYGIVTTAVFRDPSAWYHCVFVYDVDNATSADRAIIYVNGVRQAVSNNANGMFPSGYTSAAFNTAVAHRISSNAPSAIYADQYLTEMVFVDGQALTPSSFGTTDTTTGAWVSMPYTGTYGNNGFYLNFKDNTSTTTIGYDYSGNSNNWTANNISLTAGTTYDSMVDVPTSWLAYNTAGDTGALVRGNYPVLNRLDADTSGLGTSLTWGNLRATGTTYAATVYTCSFQIPQSGKWYYEVVYSAITSAAIIGIRSNSTGSTDVQYYSNGNKNVGGSTTSYGATWTTNDVMGVAVDRDAGTVTFYKNNSSQGAISIPTNSAVFDIAFNSLSPYGSASFDVNFGQRPFSYTPPTGFKTLNTFNLPAPTISNGALYMAASTYTGNGTSQSVVNSGNNPAAISFQPDFVWVKNRANGAANHMLVDSVRGATNWLASDLTAAESTNSAIVSSINSNGFSVGNANVTNQNATAIVGWQWNAGGSTVTNTSGSISSQVRASTTAGFSVVTYTGTGANATVGHGLGVAPRMIITKVRSTTNPWYSYHASLGAGSRIQLNETSAATASGLWQSTSPTSTVFSISSDVEINGSGRTFVAYCFAAVAGYSAFGSYTGNGSSDGPFVYLGFRPRYILIKQSSASGQDWQVQDTSREPYNSSTRSVLFPDLSNAEITDSFPTDFLSNGFKIRNSGSGNNSSGATYIYAAFAENPFKNSNAR
jgi:hypothetical protein